PLREASVAIRSERLGFARRAARGAGHRIIALSARERMRVPGHVPTPPRPQTGFAGGRPPPRPAATFYEAVEKLEMASRESRFLKPIGLRCGGPTHKQIHKNKLPIEGVGSNRSVSCPLALVVG